MRKFGVLFLALIVIGFFFAGFYLFIVPANKSATDKYGLLILQQLQTAIQNKMDADIGEYSAYLEHYYFKPDKPDLGSLGRQLKKLGVDSLDPSTSKVPAPKLAPGQHRDSTRGKGGAAAPAVPGGARVMISTDTDRVFGGLAGIMLGRVLYEFDYGSREIRLAVPVSHLMGDLYKSFPADFFCAFLFLKSDTAMTMTLYKSDGVPVGLQVRTDSLLKNSKGGFYPGITDLNTGSSQYKLFYIPLIRDDQQFVLCGIKDAGEYDRALHAVPAQFLYPLVIALILLVIALPLVKLYTIGPTEAIRMQDLVATGFSLLGGSMMVTLIIIQVILLKDGEARQQIGLTRLSGQLGKAFGKELKKAFVELQEVDQARAMAPEHWIGGTTGDGYNRRPGRVGPRGYDISDSLTAFLGVAADSSHDPAGNDRPYLNFDRVSWIDDQGMQIVAGSPDTAASHIFIDVSARQYFTDFKNNNCYRLPGVDTALVSVEPVLSWSDGSFRFMLARRSACPDAFLTTLSTDLYSVDRTVMPSGFGFCIINDSGLVQVHSEPSRNLVENFLQQSADAAELRAAMRGRQELYFQQTELYGKEYGLLLEPIKNMPYHLVVFYDRGYILPVNLRILVYSLVGCAVTVLSCVLLVFGLLWWGSLRRRQPARPALFDPIDHLRVLIPMRRHALAYSTGALVLEGYVILLVSLAVAGNPYSLGLNNIVIYWLFLTPLIIAVSVYLIARRFDGYGARPGYYLFNYTLLVQALVVSLGVVPAALYTWHAQNQELLQSVKREQLLKAVNLEGRRTELYEPLVHLSAAIPSYPLYTYWQYKTGIYSIFGDSLLLTDTVLPVSPTFDEQYFNVVNRWGDIDYDPQYIPVLRNQSGDRSWRWAKIAADTILPFEYTLNPDVHDTGVGAGGRTAALAPARQLLILSALPRRYPYLGYAGKAMLLMVVILLLLAGLFRLIRRIATVVFLQKWTRGNADADDPPTHPYLNEYVDQLSPGGLAPDVRGGIPLQLRAAMLAEMAAAIPLKMPHPGKSADLDEQESRVIAAAADYAGYFHSLLERCRPMERYLLYNFARTGFLNYKNVQEINRLLKEKILVKDGGRIRLFSPAFRVWFRLNVSEDMLGAVARKSDWQRFRIPFFVLLAVAAAFLFLTQQEAWQRMVALLTALSSSLATARGLLKGDGDGARGDGKGDGDGVATGA
jgi:hypothetical protein